MSPACRRYDACPPTSTPRVSESVASARRYIGCLRTGLFGSTSPNQRASSPAANEPGWPGTIFVAVTPRVVTPSLEWRAASRAAPAIATRPEAAITAMRKRRRPGSRAGGGGASTRSSFHGRRGFPPRSRNSRGNPYCQSDHRDLAGDRPKGVVVLEPQGLGSSRRHGVNPSPEAASCCNCTDAVRTIARLVTCRLDAPCRALP